MAGMAAADAAPCEWKSRRQTINNVDVAVYEPTQTTTPVVVTTPSLSVGSQGVELTDEEAEESARAYDEAQVVLQTEHDRNPAKPHDQNA